MQHSELLIDELSCRGSMPAVTQADHCRPGAPNTLRSQSYNLAAAGLHGHHRRKGSGRADNGKSDSASEHTQYLTMPLLSKAKLSQIFIGFSARFPHFPLLNFFSAPPSCCSLKLTPYSSSTAFCPILLTFHAFLALWRWPYQY